MLFLIIFFRICVKFCIQNIWMGAIGWWFPKPQLFICLINVFRVFVKLIMAWWVACQVLLHQKIEKKIQVLVPTQMYNQLIIQLSYYLNCKLHTISDDEIMKKNLILWKLSSIWVKMLHDITCNLNWIDIQVQL
jgi:hypothetical protein